MRRSNAIAALLLLAATGCSGGGDPHGHPPPPEDPSEDDWSLPAWAVASTSSGFFSEQPDAAHDVGTRVIDLSWRQIEPSPGTFVTDVPLTNVPPYYEGLDFSSLDDQLAIPGDVWLRFWVSDVELAPGWIASECAGLAPIDAEGYENDEHWPIWDPCFWTHAREAWRHVLLTLELRSDPRVRFVYAPGAFTYSEFDFDLVEASGVSFAVFQSWFETMTADLVAIANGENAGAADDFAHKLVYTGEDYPFSSFGAADDALALDAVVGGMGIRTGITELFNFHLSHVPSYGTTIASDGHMVTDELAPAFATGKTRATENECYQDCGYFTAHPYYAVKMSNLKALQLRMNWIYVVPGPSFMDEFPALWEWVRLSIGKTPFDSPDAWVALREAEDRYWIGDDSLDWEGKPFVKNLERWLVQREVANDGETIAGLVEREAILDADNGLALEGRLATSWMYFDVDERFLSANETVDVKVTWLDRHEEPGWTIEYATAGGIGSTAPVARAGDGEWHTTTVRITDAAFDDSLPGSTDFRIGENMGIRFVRVVKVDP